MAEVHAEAIATGNGSRPTEHHARETPGLDHRRASLTLRPEGRPTDDADSGADSALGESNGSAPPSARRAASVPPSIDGASSAVTLRGRLSSTLINEFEELSLTPSVQPVQTILAGPVEDQAALHGLVRRIEALGLELVELRRLPRCAGDEADIG